MVWLHRLYVISTRVSFLYICQVNGFAAAFEKAGDDVSYAAVSNFFSLVTTGHSFATGGSNDHEYWGPARTMADAVLLVRCGHLLAVAHACRAVIQEGQTVLQMAARLALMNLAVNQGMACERS